MEKEFYKSRISMHDFILKNGIIYFSTLNYNGLYTYDLKNEKLNFIAHFPNERRKYTIARNSLWFTTTLVTVKSLSRVQLFATRGL